MSDQLSGTIVYPQGRMESLALFHVVTLGDVWAWDLMDLDLLMWFELRETS